MDRTSLKGWDRDIHMLVSIILRFRLTFDNYEMDRMEIGSTIFVNLGGQWKLEELVIEKW